ncbi:MAG: branched-chain amino acid ABC transporter permease [Proteobacteria bacterium]|nr:branched-chain amino acid ABC transporter permease [Pseudomonadota bacterium]
MDLTILLFLLQDGLTNGAVYALLGLALVLVFAVTRVIFIPQGEFVAYGGLTYALLSTGKVPGTAWMMLCFGLAAFLFEVAARGRTLTPRDLAREVAMKIVWPLAILAITRLIVSYPPSALVNVVLSVAIVGSLGPYLYRIAYQPIEDASVLVLLIASVGVHLAMLGLGLVFFGPEGLRAEALISSSFNLGPLLITGQSIAVYVATIALIVALALFFETSIHGKALRATAINRVGARLVGIRTVMAGRIAFALAAAIGAISGLLIVPATTLYYDTGFLIGLKGFVAAIIGGLVSYPLTAIAALGVGIVEAFASFYASNYKEIIVFTLLLPILTWRSLTHTDHDEEE